MAASSSYSRPRRQATGVLPVRYNNDEGLTMEELHGLDVLSEDEAEGAPARRTVDAAELSPAVRAGLPFDRLGARESGAFRGLLEQTAMSNAHRERLKRRIVSLRNMCLKIWSVDAGNTRFVSFEECAEQLGACGDGDHSGAGDGDSDVRALLKQVYSFLHRHGLINFGMPSSEREKTEAVVPAKAAAAAAENSVDGFEATPSGLEGAAALEGKKVIVIGAGAAGLSAAFQLQHRYGCSVMVLEGRDRIGGRVFTDTTSFSAPVDLGASIVTGCDPDTEKFLQPDPSADLVRKLAADAPTASGADGAPCLYELGRDAPLYDGVTGGPINEEADERGAQMFDELLNHASEFLEAEGEGALYDKSLGSAMETELTRLVAKQLTEGKGKFSGQAHRAVGWHWANLEYGCSAKLTDVSLAHWNKDEEFGGFGGSHCLVKGGYSRPLEYLASQLADVRLNCIVSRVEVLPTGVKVTESTNADREIQTVHEADAVLVTVPLGVLKRGDIAFKPELPPWKQGCINRLGMGSLNKIAMEFPSVFWDDVDIFGVALENHESSRGRCFMFWNMYRFCGRPIIIGLFAGKAASDVESLPAEEVCDIAVRNLRQLFFRERPSDMPRPLSYRVTRWKEDPFARGSYSYVAVGSSLKDYDDLGHPVTFSQSWKNGDNAHSFGAGGDGGEERATNGASTEQTDAAQGERQAYRLFFAGEHTCKEHPDTVGGAMLSGRREATRIALSLQGRDPNSEMDELIVVDDGVRLEIAKQVEHARRLAINDASDDSMLLRIMNDAQSNGQRRVLLVEVLQLSAQTIKQMFGPSCLEALAAWIREYSTRASFDILNLLLKVSARIPFDSKEELKATGLPRSILEIIKRSRKSRASQESAACAAANKVMRRWQMLRGREDGKEGAGASGAACAIAESEHHQNLMMRIREEKEAAADRAREAMQAAEEAEARARQKMIEMQNVSGSLEEPETVDFEEFNRQMKRKKKLERLQRKREEETARAENTTDGSNGDEQGKKKQKVNDSDNKPLAHGEHGDGRGIENVRSAVMHFATESVLQPIVDRGSITVETRDSVAATALEKVLGGSKYLQSHNISVSEFMSETRKRKIRDLLYAILKKQGVRVEKIR